MLEELYEQLGISNGNYLGESEEAGQIRNHAKTIKKIYLGRLGKKFKFGKIKKALEKLTDLDISGIKKFALKFVVPYDFTEWETEHILKLVTAYIVDRSEKEKISGFERKHEISELFIDEIQEKLDSNMITSEEVQESLLKRGRTSNSDCMGLTPEKYVQVSLPDFTLEDLDFNEAELGVDPSVKSVSDFYGTYSGRFSQKEEKLWSKAIELSHKGKVNEALEVYKNLMQNHGEFFRLVYNYWHLLISQIIEKYDHGYDGTDSIENFHTFLNTVGPKEIKKDLKVYREYSTAILDLEESHPDYFVWGRDASLHSYIRLLIGMNLSMAYGDVFKMYFKKLSNKEKESYAKEYITNMFIGDYSLEKRIENTKKTGHEDDILDLLKNKDDFGFAEEAERDTITKWIREKEKDESGGKLVQYNELLKYCFRIEDNEDLTDDFLKNFLDDTLRYSEQPVYVENIAKYSDLYEYAQDTTRVNAILNHIKTDTGKEYFKTTISLISKMYETSRNFKKSTVKERELNS